MQLLQIEHHRCDLFPYSSFENIFVSRRHFIMQCERGVQAMAKNIRNSHTTIDVEKIHKRKVAIISACWLCVELVPGEDEFIYFCLHLNTTNVCLFMCYIFRFTHL